MKRALLILFILLLAIISSVLTRLNLETVTFNYYFATLQLSLALLLFFALLSGALLGFIFTISLAISTRAERRTLRRTLQLREQEIRNLRNIPIKDRH
jgi:uncharacterized integral membrane protein